MLLGLAYTIADEVYRMIVTIAADECRPMIGVKRLLEYHDPTRLSMS